jgi:hypothetical protein
LAWQFFAKKLSQIWLLVEKGHIRPFPSMGEGQDGG